MRIIWTVKLTIIIIIIIINYKILYGWKRFSLWYLLKTAKSLCTKESLEIGLESLKRERGCRALEVSWSMYRRVLHIPLYDNKLSLLLFCLDNRQYWNRRILLKTLIRKIHFSWANSRCIVIEGLYNLSLLFPFLTSAAVKWLSLIHI